MNCGKRYELNKFSKCMFNTDGREVYCSKCKKEIVGDKDSLIKYLELNGIEYNDKTWKSAYDYSKKYELKKSRASNKDESLPSNIDQLIIKRTIGQYFKLQNIEGDFKAKQNNKVKQKINIEIDLDDKTIEKWGYGYTNEEYALFERRYNRLIRSYSEKTEMHTEALLTYIRYRVREELATAKGDVKDAKEWGSLAQKAAQDAKINPSQMSKSDISGGVDVVAQLFEAVESEVGIIPFLPKLLEQPYDDADMIIWCTINNLRRLEDKPVVKYRDIYCFYDEMLKEHYKQNGWNEQQIEEFLKKRNNVFRNMEEVYVEPLYEQQDIEDESEEVAEIEGEI